MKIYFLTIGLVKRLQCTYALYKSSRLMVNSLPELSLMPMIILAVTCSRMYLMPVTLSISLMPMSFSLISFLVRSGRGSGSRTNGLRPRFLGVEAGTVAGVVAGAVGMSGKRFPSDVCSFIAIVASVLVDVDCHCCLVDGAAAN